MPRGVASCDLIEPVLERGGFRGRVKGMASGPALRIGENGPAIQQKLQIPYNNIK